MLHGLCFGEEGGARNLVFFRVKWLQATMKGTSWVPLFCFRCFTTCKGSFLIVPVRKMPHQNIRLNLVFSDSGADCVESIPIEPDFECANGNLYFLMGPELYAVTIFFG